jgi:hypothetical protein
MIFVVCRQVLVSVILASLLPTTSSLAPNSWHKRLDKALLDVDGARTPQARIRLIQRAIKDPQFKEDVTRGIDAIQTKGFGKGHPILIEALWPKGTIARSDIEGIQALVKSVPERVDELRESYSDGDNNTSLLNVIQSSTMNNNLSRDDVSRIVQRGLTLSTDMNLIQNLFRRDPKNVETLSSQQVDMIQIIGDDENGNGNKNANDTKVEIRHFDSFPMLYCELQTSNDYTLRNMANGLIKLSNYVILGNNNEEENGSMSDMTTPFIIQNSRMFMKCPDTLVNDVQQSFDQNDDENDDDDDDNNNDVVKIGQCKEQTMALLEFSGICTNAEIGRQKEKLLQVLKEGNSSNNNDNDDKKTKKWNIVNDSILVLQYNAPGTLPWRRKNQVAFLVEEEEVVGDMDNSSTSLNENEKEEDSVSPVPTTTTPTSTSTTSF